MNIKDKSILKHIISIILFFLAFLILKDGFIKELIAFILIIVGVYIQGD